MCLRSGKQASHKMRSNMRRILIKNNSLGGGPPGRVSGQVSLTRAQSPNKKNLESLKKKKENEPHSVKDKTSPERSPSGPTAMRLVCSRGGRLVSHKLRSILRKSSSLKKKRTPRGPPQGRVSSQDNLTGSMAYHEKLKKFFKKRKWTSSQGRAVLPRAESKCLSEQRDVAFET